MHILTMFVLLLAAQGLWAQPIRQDVDLDLGPDSLDHFWVQIPEGYNPAQPPAVVVWWHGYGGDRHELLGAVGWADSLNARGWIGACHTGAPNTHHYQVPLAQRHCRAMLDWLMENYPFSRDSVYMVGSSMGAAGPFIWHNNNCGVLEYPLAAGAGGSAIIDTELRQHQYIDSGHINNAMIEDFGGIPDTSDSVDFQYHRASAVHLADTTQSMHFNSLHLPCYTRWGTTDSSWSAEWFAYGRPAQQWDTLRQADNSAISDFGCSGLSVHGYFNLRIDSTLNFFAAYSCNRFPNVLSINADEDDEYYWTRVTLRDTAYVFGRYGVSRDFEQRRLDINLIRNIDTLDVEFLFPWTQYDSLRGHWINRDSVSIPATVIRLTHLPTPVTALWRNGVSFPFTFADSTCTIVAPPSGDYSVSFDLYAGNGRPEMPRKISLESAYPNPFNSQLVLDISSNSATVQTMRLYDITGRLARSLSISLSPGLHHVPLSGDGLASGIYFVTLSGTSQVPLKVVLLK